MQQDGAGGFPLRENVEDGGEHYQLGEQQEIDKCGQKQGEVDLGQQDQRVLLKGGG